MRRPQKIVLTTFCSIIGIMMLILGAATWIIFTPERLTPIVRKVAKEYIKCEHHIGKVELTFFSTFPHFGLAIDSVAIVNPLEGAPNDTVIQIPHAIVGLDVMAFLKEETLSISTLSAPEIEANIFVDAYGRANYDVLALESDTTAEEENTTNCLPFKNIKVEGLELSAHTLRYVSIADSIDIILQGALIDAQVAEWDDMLLTLEIKSIDAVMGSAKVAQGLRLSTNLPASVDMEKMRVTLHNAQLAINNLAIALDGWAEIGDSLQTNMRLTLHDWEVDSMMALLPTQLDKEITTLVKGGKISLDANAAIHMGNGKQSEVTIHKAAAQIRHTDIALKGRVIDPLGKLWMDLSADMNILISDIKTFLPADMQVAGRVKGNTQVQIFLDDLIAMQLEKGKITGDLQLEGVNYLANGIEANLPNNRLQFHIPNTHPSRKEVDWLNAILHTDGGKASINMPLAATFGKTEIAIEANNILGDDPWLHATLALHSHSQLNARMDSVDITVLKPNITTYIAYHMSDTTIMPVVDAQLAFDKAYGHYTNIEVDIANSTLTAMLQAPRLQASLQSQALYAQMGEEMKVKTKLVDIMAAARYNSKGGDNMLLKWNPKLEIDLQDAELALADLEQKIEIPNIDFHYNNRECKIEQSKIIFGNSDFALTGELRNMGRWMRKKGILEGELNFESSHTDVNELLSLLSADQGSEETLESEDTAVKNGSEIVEKQESEPFLVPTNINLTLNTLIKEANVFNQTATNLGGKIYVKNGAAVVEEMGFICNAAKLQLTGIYRTPRRNHIYAGFDYHMMDINIQELIGMIPQLDSMMPMLRSFKGEAEFHLAAETYLNAKYEIKPSTLRGAASIYGKDLVVLDSETFNTISKLLLFSKKTENKVDSLSAELTLYKKEIDIYPFCVSMDNYMVALGGQHNLDMTFNYDINVLSPIYLGVNVSGNLDDLDIKLAPCKFAKDFKPIFHRKVDTQSAELRMMIRESMRKNVKTPQP